jgi:hypothetical protein
MILNCLISMRRATYNAIKQDAKDEKLAKRFIALLRDEQTLVYTERTVSGQVWKMFELQMPKGKLDDLVEFLAGYPAANWKLVGVWEYETGLQLGQRFHTKADGSTEIRGTPTYPVNTTELLKFLPPINVYDANGNLVSSTPRTSAEDVHLWLGQALRLYA